MLISEMPDKELFHERYKKCKHKGWAYNVILRCVKCYDKREESLERLCNGDVSNGQYSVLSKTALHKRTIKGEYKEKVQQVIAGHLGERNFLFFFLHPFLAAEIKSHIKDPSGEPKVKLILAKIVIAFILWGLIFGGVGTGAYFATTAIIKNYLQKIDENSITLLCNKKYNELPLVERTYGELLDISSIKVAYQYNSHDSWHYLIPSLDSVYGYDTEKIGYQKSVISFSSRNLEFYVNTYPLEINAPVLSLKQEDRKLTWKAVTGAGSYNVLVGENSDNLTYLDETSSLEYDLSSVEQDGNLFFAVQAIKESEKYSDSHQSNLVNVLKLPSAETLTYTGNDAEKMITWSSVPYADYYNLTIDGHINENIIGTSFTFDAPAGEHEILLTAHSNLVNSIYSDTRFSFSVLDQVTGLRITDSYIEWNEVENATSYDVFLNSSTNPINVTTNKLSTIGTDAGLYSINVVAKNISSSVYNSHDSAEYNALINFKIDIHNNVLSWPNLGDKFSYFVYVDDVVATSSIITNTFDFRTMNLNSGSHAVKVLVKHQSLDVANDLSNVIEITKLAAPVLSVSNNTVVAEGSDAPVTLYIDGVEFDGSLEGVSADSHTITGKYFAATDLQIDSEVSYLQIAKLSAPVLTIYDEKISCDYPARTIKYYLDGVEFDGQLDDISVGEHQITARYIGNGTTIMDSDLCEPKTITKLGIPVLKYENHEIICTKNNINLEYFDGETTFSGLYADLSRGYHLVSARNVGDGVNTISSKVSSVIEVYRTDASVTYNKIDNEKFIVRLNTQDTVISMSLSATFYLNDSIIDSINYPSVEDFYQTLRLKRTGGTADRVDIVVTIVITCEQGNFTDIINSQYIPL